MTFPLAASPGPADGSSGYSYGAVLVAAADGVPVLVEQVLRGIRFSGWIAPPRDGWVVAVGDPGAGVVAESRGGVIEVAAAVARRVPGTVVAVQVRRDRQLAIVAWRDGDEVARYCSDPAQEPDAEREVLTEPVGADGAPEIADAVGRRDAGEELFEILDDEIDTDSVFESERLRRVLALLGLPRWIVAAGELPRDIPTGPRSGELLRLRAGETGFAGLLRNGVVARLRRRHAPPPVIDEPPMGMGFDEWML